MDLYVEENNAPRIRAPLKLSPTDVENADKIFSAVLYVTPQSQAFVAKFKSTIHIAGEDTLENYQQSVGHWGCVSIVPRKDQHEEFPCVVYVTQNRQMRQIVEQLQKAEKEGLLEWA